MSKLLNVGKRYRLPGGVTRQLRYKDVEYDGEGWASCDSYMPQPYDAVEMYVNNEKVLPGWWNGVGWDGLKVRKKDLVTKWKRLGVLIYDRKM